jgi:LuxR family transcriptional regulator, maltose regulon positive regulatory protein
MLLLTATRGRPAHSLNDIWKVRRAIVRARSAFIGMRLEDASRATEELRRLLSISSGSHLSRYVYALRTLDAVLLAAGNDLSASRGQLMSLGTGKGEMAAATILRYVDWRLGMRDEALPSDPVDYLAAPVGGKAVFRIFGLCISAALAFDRLLPALSASLAAEALQLARRRYGNHSPMTAFPATLLAQVAYEQGRFEEAESLLRPRLSVIRSSRLEECVARASVLLARLALHQGRHGEALAILRETETLGRARRWPRLVSIASTEAARTAAMAHFNERQVNLCAPRAESAKFPAALPSEENLNFSAIEAALERACSTSPHGPVSDIFELLTLWLRLGAARGLRMVFVDAGPPLSALLERLYSELPTNDARLSDLRPYIAMLLKSTVRTNTDQARAFTYRPLSCRETGILQMIAYGMSNKGIAKSLGITPETVKSHAKNIFAKLATRTRAHAVARAEAIGLL